MDDHLGKDGIMQIYLDAPIWVKATATPSADLQLQHGTIGE